MGMVVHVAGSHYCWLFYFVLHRLCPDGGGSGWCIVFPSVGVGEKSDSSVFDRVSRCFRKITRGLLHVCVRQKSTLLTLFSSGCSALLLAFVWNVCLAGVHVFFFSFFFYFQEASSATACAFAIVLSLVVVVFSGRRESRCLQSWLKICLWRIVFNFRMPVRSLTTAVTTFLRRKLRLCLCRDGDVMGRTCGSGLELLPLMQHPLLAPCT